MIEIRSFFADHMDLIQNKRAIVIKPSSFPPGVSLANICEKLATLLDGMQQGYLEQLSIIDFKATALPSEFQLLLSPRLKVLDLHNNHLSSFPPNLALCPNLESVDLSQNLLKILRLEDVAGFSSLRHLLLKDNWLLFIPPSLGDMYNLESLVISGNPLILPHSEYCERNLTKISDLKAYLRNNRLLLDQQIDNQQASKPITPSAPNFMRNRSLSETKVKSSKASRRMGLIINNCKVSMDSGFSTVGNYSLDVITSTNAEKTHQLPTDGKVETNGDYRDQGIQDNSRRAASTVSNLSLSKTLDNANLSRAVDYHLNRANTLKEEILTRHGESHDFDTKLNTSSRRLSTLKERPQDELFRDRHDEGLLERHKLDEAKSYFGRASVTDTSPTKASKTPKTTVRDHGQSALISPPFNFNSFLAHSTSALNLMVKILLYNLREVHQSLIRLSWENKNSTNLESIVQFSAKEISSVQDKFDLYDASEDNLELLLSALAAGITSFKLLIHHLNEVLKPFILKSPIYCQRAIYMSFYGALHELNNIYKVAMSVSLPLKLHLSNGKGNLLKSPNLSENLLIGSILIQAKDLVTDNSLSEFSSTDIDGRLLIAVESSTADALVVLRELITTMNAFLSSTSKSSQSLSPTLSAKCVDLHSVCTSTMEITRKLTKNLCAFEAQSTFQVKKLLWDDINAYLKSILLIFATVKGIMNDAPVLNEVRQSMANLTKSTKEVTILLEASSFKNSSELQKSPLNNNLPPQVSSSFAHGPIPNPLVTATSTSLLQLGNSNGISRAPNSSIQSSGVP